MGKGFGTGKLKKGKQHNQAYRDFLLEVLQATLDSTGNQQIVCPLLQANLDKLDSTFAQLLQDWAITILPTLTSEEAVSIAGTIADFSRLIQGFPLGNRANNLEIAIAGCEIAQTVLTFEAFPEVWALIQNNLGIVYRERIQGNRAENLEQAISCYANALLICIRETSPEEWAKLQNNLGSAYWERIQGERSTNLEHAIDCYQNALKVRTRKAFPKEWINTQSNLALVFLERIQGDRAENLEQAIAYCQNALQVCTCETFPEQWANIQNNLALAYRDRLREERVANLEKAIDCLQNASQVFTLETFPEKWAWAQHNLATVYCELIDGNREQNLERAISCSQKALQVFTSRAFPEYWARTQMNLGNAYRERICGNRVKNLKQATICYQNALQVCTREAFPERWALIQANLSTVCYDKEQISETIKCCQLALEIYTPTSFPLYCFRGGRNLGNAAFTIRLWKEAIEGYGKAIEAVETSRSWATSESRRQEILAEAIDVYENMVQACINAGQLEKAIETVERSRSKRLVDLMASNDLYQPGEIPPEVKDLLQQYEDLQQQIDQERSQNNSSNNRELMGVGSSTKDRAAFQAYNEAIASLEAEKQQIWEQLRRLDPVLAGEIQVSAPDFCAMQKLIDQPTTAILSFYTTSKDTYIFVLRQNQITLHTCTGQGTETLQSWIFQNWLIPYIEDGSAWQSQISVFLSELAQRLQINDLISQHLGNITELIVVPHLALHQIPLAALPIGNGQYLGDKFLIRYTASCQVLEFCNERGEVREQLTYGTVEDATEDLPFASFEGEQIARLYNIPESDRLKGRSQCTKSNYSQLASRVQVLHSCHHAQSRLDEPLESILQLAGETITLGELLTPGWRLQNLCDVFLSCCETGLGVPESLTDDILTLSTGFLCAGARIVVSSLWSVDDMATAIFSIFYYQHRYQGKSRPESLRQAQIELRELKKEELLNREDIKELSRQTEAGRKEARNKRSQYESGSADYLKWDCEYRKYASITNQIYNVKNSQDKEPFSHPRYWAAFTCSGLR